MMSAELLDKPDISIVVPNWEGRDMLPRCLSSLQIAARESGRPCEIIVVDDASRDGSAAIVRERFPRVRLFVNRVNRGFARSVNRGVAFARGRILILANNDLSVREDFVANLVRWFYGFSGATPLFAVSARTVSWYDGRPNQLCMGAVWRGGRITPAWDDPDKARPCLFVQAGAAAYDRELFLRIGGLSTLYEPGYWEDYDLSWRAARREWRMLYDPDAFSLHVGGGSMTRRYGAERVALMKARNHLLFEMANLRDARLVAEWAGRMPLNAARSRLYTRALREALARRGAALAQRLREPSGESDLSILGPYRMFTPSY